MLLSLVLSQLVSSAGATEVAVDKRLGLGVATGYPYASFTMKYWLDDRSGIAGYVGSAVVLHTLRVAYQREIAELANWDFARFPLYWQAGLDLGLWTPGYGYAGAYTGVYGGAGVALQFHSVPAEVFAELHLGVYPLNGYCHDANRAADGACWVSGGSSVGGRWYF